MKQAVADLGMKNDELEQIKKDLLEWTVRKENGKAGVLSFSVRSAKSLDGQELDQSNILIKVHSDGEASEITADNEVSAGGEAGVFGLENAKRFMDTFKIELESLDTNLKVTCHQNFLEAPSGEEDKPVENVQSGTDVVVVDEQGEKDKEDIPSNLESQPSVQSVPYVAIFNAHRTPSDTTERSDIEAICAETGESIILSVNALFDDCDSAIASATDKAKDLEKRIEELETSLKNAVNNQQNAEPIEAIENSSSSAGGEASPKKKQKKAKQGKSTGLSFAQKGQIAVHFLSEYRSYWLFGSAALAIYYFGDSASV